jgi:hypothetical protein
MLPILNKELSLSGTGIPYSQILPLQLFGFHLVFEYVLHLFHNKYYFSY